MWFLLSFLVFFFHILLFYFSAAKIIFFCLQQTDLFFFCLIIVDCSLLPKKTYFCRQNDYVQYEQKHLTAPNPYHTVVPLLLATHGERRGTEEAAQVCGSRLFEAGRQGGDYHPFVLWFYRENSPSGQGAAQLGRSLPFLVTFVSSESDLNVPLRMRM